MVIYQGRRRYWRRSHQFRISLACWRAGRRNSGLEYKANAKHGFLALFSNHYYFGLVSILLLVWFENLWNLCGRVTFSQAAVVAFFNSLAEGGMQASVMVQKLSPSMWCISNIKKKKDRNARISVTNLNDLCDAVLLEGSFSLQQKPLCWSDATSWHCGNGLTGMHLQNYVFLKYFFPSPEYLQNDPLHFIFVTSPYYSIEFHSWFSCPCWHHM
jgi:hypothetical protein